jgi:hypothetical protein
MGEGIKITEGVIIGGIIDPKLAILLTQTFKTLVLINQRLIMTTEGTETIGKTIVRQTTIILITSRGLGTIRINLVLVILTLEIEKIPSTLIENREVVVIRG